MARKITGTLLPKKWNARLIGYIRGVKTKTVRLNQWDRFSISCVMKHLIDQTVLFCQYVDDFLFWIRAQLNLMADNFLGNTKVSA